MAPVRRYLRISKYSVLECRIYVDNPALVQSWLLHPRDPVLPRVIESVRPLVLPKLMEERERAKKKGTKKKGAIRDVLVEEDFEVSLFLNETNTRHSLLFKHRRARDKTQTRLVSNSSKLTGGTSDAPIDVENGEDGDLRVEIDQDGNDENDDGDEDIVLTAANVGGSSSRRQPDRERPPPNLLLEDSDEEVPMALQDIPDIQQVNEEDGDTEDTTTRRSKRRRQDPVQVRDSDDEDEDGGDGQDGADSDNDSLFMSDNDNDDLVADAPPSKRSRIVPVDADMDDESSRKKKKLAMDVVYEGFAIYGRVLCLVVKRRGPPRGRGAQTVLPVSAGGGRAGNASAAPEPMKPGGQAAMVNWIASTQMPIPQTGDTDMS